MDKDTNFICQRIKVLLSQKFASSPSQHDVACLNHSVQLWEHHALGLLSQHLGLCHSCKVSCILVLLHVKGNHGMNCWTLHDICPILQRKLFQTVLKLQILRLCSAMLMKSEIINWLYLALSQQTELKDNNPAMKCQFLHCPAISCHWGIYAQYHDILWGITQFLFLKENIIA